MEKIKSITEAFSQQPAFIQVTTQEKYDAMKFGKENAVKEIKCETLQTGSDTANDYYIGYGFDGKKLFEYLRASVNVHYFGA